MYEEWVAKGTNHPLAVPKNGEDKMLPQFAWIVLKASDKIKKKKPPPAGMDYDAFLNNYKIDSPTAAVLHMSR